MNKKSFFPPGWEVLVAQLHPMGNGTEVEWYQGFAKSWRNCCLNLENGFSETIVLVCVDMRLREIHKPLFPGRRNISWKCVSIAFLFWGNHAPPIEFQILRLKKSTGLHFLWNCWKFAMSLCKHHSKHFYTRWPRHNSNMCFFKSNCEWLQRTC